MHELSIAQALVDEAERVARAHGAARVDRILVRVGELSGVEASLLERAFEMARAGTLATTARLELEPGPIEINCRSCGASGPAMHNRLTCSACGDWNVDVTAGEELLLMRLELAGIPDEAAAPPTTSSPRQH